ncbi:hypothetical protein EDD22DRAFT_866954 [Suillus occidentalis]|nr:hypothetical protein EDD22DRAFT_866954 [Suillus occidentalis]
MSSLPVSRLPLLLLWIVDTILISSPVWKLYGSEVGTDFCDCVVALDNVHHAFILCIHRLLFVPSTATTNGRTAVICQQHYWQLVIGETK